MGKKIDRRGTYGKKLLHLFARLLFSGEAYSLTEISRILECSKPTVLRLLSDIQMGYPAQMEEEKRGNKKYVRIKKPVGEFPMTSLSQSEWQILHMCRSFAEHLLGKRLFEEATQALLKSRALMHEKDSPSLKHFASFRSGTIDYTDHRQTIHTLIEAMEQKKICKLTYQSLGQSKAHSLYIKPLKLFSHHDTIYLHAQKTKTPGEKYRTPQYDPLLAVHRIRKVELTERNFTSPDFFDFEKTFNKHFGVMKEEAFEVKVEFTGWSANYVKERIWSPSQKIEKIGRNKIRLTFTASSEPELIGWLLYFGEEAKLIKPDWLIEEVAQKTKKMAAMYS
ncbi:MAG: WYL domain-containing protein [Deltaproteobacteria bacterium]|nr:WYL domain-containing protein [Deltaproteobacteria bacterium]